MLNKQVIDYGIVSPGQKLTFKFEVIDGRKIKSLDTSCGCTTTNNGDYSFSGEIKIPTDLSKHSTKYVKYNKSITVTYEKGSAQVVWLYSTVDKSQRPVKQ